MTITGRGVGTGGNKGYMYPPLVEEGNVQNTANEQENMTNLPLLLDVQMEKVFQLHALSTEVIK